MPKLELVVNNSGTDKDFFEDWAAYRAYREEEEYLRTIPVDATTSFDWLYLLKILFSRG